MKTSYRVGGEAGQNLNPSLVSTMLTAFKRSPCAGSDRRGFALVLCIQTAPAGARIEPPMRYFRPAVTL
jgi:hypothetical protein